MKLSPLLFRPKSGLGGVATVLLEPDETPETPQDNISPRDRRRIWAYNESGVPICGMVRTDGTYCRHTGINRNGRCHVHGGNARRGANHPAYGKGKKGLSLMGRYAGLPDGLRQKYEEELARPDIGMEEDIAATGARISELVDSSGDIEPGILKLITPHLQTLISYGMDAFPTPETRTAFEAIVGLIGQAMKKQVLWSLVEKAQEHRRKLVDTQVKIDVARQQTLTADRAMAIVLALETAVKECVSSAEERAAVGKRILELVEGPKAGDALAGARLIGADAVGQQLHTSPLPETLLPGDEAYPESLVEEIIEIDVD